MSHDHHDIGVLVRLTNDRQDGFGGGVVERPQVMDFGLGTATRPQAFGRLASAGGRGAERLIDAKAMLMQPPTGLARLGYPPLGEFPLVIAVRAVVHGLGMAHEDEGAVLCCGGLTPILLRPIGNVTPCGAPVGKFDL